MYLNVLYLGLLCIIWITKQFDITFTKNIDPSVLGTMKKCVTENLDMNDYNNMLKLNDDKTELFIFAPQRQIDAFQGLSIKIYN